MLIKIKLNKGFWIAMRCCANAWKSYQANRLGLVTFQKWHKHSQNNCAYAPVLFENEVQLFKVEAKLKENRRYFYPSLDSLSDIQSKQVCKHSRDIPNRILCLPIYPSLSKAEQKLILNLLVGVEHG